jgi:TonB family protein
MRLALSLLVISLLAACASQSVPQVSYETAHQSYMQGDFKLATQQLQPLATTGDVRAERDLGLIYLMYGDGTRDDFQKGTDLLKAAAMGGDAEAQLEYGRLYGPSLSIPGYAEAAHELYQKAADQGLPEAEVELGRDYMDGQGVPLDYAVALSWFNKAADAGDARASAYLGDMYFNGYGVTQDQVHGMELYQRAAKGGDRKAALFLGACYQNGQCGLLRDEVAAQRYYKQASEGVVRSYGELSEAMKDTIDSHKLYPHDSVTATQSGLVVVEFDCPDRVPKNIKIAQSSGFPLLDAAAVQAVQASYFPDRIPPLKAMKHFKIGVNFMLHGPNSGAVAASPH